MSSALTETNEWTDPVVAITDSDVIEQTVLRTPLQGILNRTKRLASRLVGGATASTFEFLLGSAVCHAHWKPSIVDAGTGYLLIDNTGGGLENKLAFFFVPPVGCKIDEIHCRVDGGAGRASGLLPASPPQISLLYRDLSIDSSGGVAGSTAADSSADVTAYQLRHNISATAINHTVLAERIYWVELTGEHGANSESGQLFCTGVRIVMKDA